MMPGGQVSGLHNVKTRDKTKYGLWRMSVRGYHIRSRRSQSRYCKACDCRYTVIRDRIQRADMTNSTSMTMTYFTLGASGGILRARHHERRLTAFGRFGGRYGRRDNFSARPRLPEAPGFSVCSRKTTRKIMKRHPTSRAANQAPVTVRARSSARKSCRCWMPSAEAQSARQHG